MVCSLRPPTRRSFANSARWAAFSSAQFMRRDSVNLPVGMSANLARSRSTVFETIEAMQIFDLAAFPSRAKYQLALAVSVRLAEHLHVGTVPAAVTPDTPKQHALDHAF